MWELTSLTIESAVLDCSSSGQGLIPVSRLLQDGEVIFNATELIDWEPRLFQAIVCEACGIPGCADDGWITLRSSGGFVLLVPAFDEISESRQEQVYYAPPRYLIERGAAILTNADYDQLRELLPKLPRRDDRKNLRSRQAISLLQREAPYQLLGMRTNHFTIRDDHVVGTSHGEVRPILDEITGLAEALVSEDRPVAIRQLRPDEDVISVYMDLFEFVEWGVIVRSGSQNSLMLSSKYVLATEAPSN